MSKTLACIKRVYTPYINGPVPRGVTNYTMSEAAYLLLISVLTEEQIETLGGFESSHNREHWIGPL